MKVNIISSGHQARDHRLFDKEARTLTAAGASVHVIAHNERDEIVDNIHIIALPQVRSRIVRFFITPWNCLRIGLKHPADVWHVQDAEMLFICPLFKLIFPKKVIIYDRHEDFPQLIARREWIPIHLRELARKTTTFFENALVRSVDGVVTVSEFLSRSFPDMPTLPVYNFPTLRFVKQLGRYALKPDQRPYDLIHLGVLSSERLSFLSSILELLKDHKKNFRAIVLGVTVSQKEYLESQFRTMQLDVQTWIPYAELPEWLGKAKIGLNIHPMLYPHLIGALPVKVIEYMAAGCSVISSKLPELKKITAPDLERGLYLIASTQPEAYAQAILEFLDDPELLERNHYLLPHIVIERLTWEQQGEQLVNFYEFMLGRRETYETINN